MRLRLRLAASALLATLGSAAVALAQPAPSGPPERVRGEFASLKGEALMLHGTSGDETIQMAPGWAVRATTPGTMAAIKPGMAIGVVSRGPADHPVAVAIQVFPPDAVPRLGQSAWDMLPESTMTNAVVAGEVTTSGAQALSLKIDDKVIPMTVAPNVNIGVAKAGDKAMLVPGAKMVVFATRAADGSHTGRLAIVGLDGSTPPL